MTRAVDALFDELFLDIFLEREFESGFIGKRDYCNVLQVKLSDDQELKDLLMEQFDTIDLNKDGMVSQGEVKKIIEKILKRQMHKVNSEKEKTQPQIRDGSYAQNLIASVLDSYKDHFVSGDEETFNEIANLLEYFYNNLDIN